MTACLPADAPRPLRAFVALPPLPVRAPCTRAARRRHTTPVAALGRVLVVGASRGAGWHVAAAAVRAGAADVVGTGRGVFADVEGVEGVEGLVLDALDRKGVVRVMAEVRPDVIVSCVAGGVEEVERPEYAGNVNLIDAAIVTGVKRFVMVSALGAGDSENSVPAQVLDSLRPVMLDKSRAEVYLKKSGLAWTIARPGPLVDGAMTGSAVLTKGLNCYGTVTRADLAEMLVKLADAESAVAETFQVVDRASVLVTSPYVRPLEFWEPLPFDEHTLL